MKIILSIDGGGIRGIIPVSILCYLEKKIQEIKDDKKFRIASYVDLVAGTSTGAIIGAAMLIPNGNSSPKYSMEDILQIYINMGEKIFKTSFWHNLKNGWSLLGPKYPNYNIEKPLEKFGKCKMKHLIKPCMFTGYDIIKRKVQFYTNMDKKRKFAEYYVKDIVRGSTAVPSYFSPAYFKYGKNINTVIDGGMFANNPSMAAYVEASKIAFNKNGIHEKVKERSPKDLFIISLGTGRYQFIQYSYKKAKKWGNLQWINPIIDILLTSHTRVICYEMEKLYSAHDRSEHFIRLNPPLIKASPEFNDASTENLNNLADDVNLWINENKTRLNLLAHTICDIKTDL